jgi:hypothetical protein
LGDWVND